MPASWILEELQRWDHSAIQSRFFTTGLFTHLHIEPITNGNLIAWNFRFRDLGLDHLFSRRCLVADDSIVDIETGELTIVASVPALLDAVFGGFNQFLKELYMQLNVPVN